LTDQKRIVTRCSPKRDPYMSTEWLTIALREGSIHFLGPRALYEIHENNQSGRLNVRKQFVYVCSPKWQHLSVHAMVERYSPGESHRCLTARNSLC
jgi:hypothetical protein